MKSPNVKTRRAIYFLLCFVGKKWRQDYMCVHSWCRKRMMMTMVNVGESLQNHSLLVTCTYALHSTSPIGAAPASFTFPCLLRSNWEIGRPTLKKLLFCWDVAVYINDDTNEEGCKRCQFSAQMRLVLLEIFLIRMKEPMKISAHN